MHAHVPARLPPESCLITSGSSQSSDSATVAGERELEREEAGRASRRVGWRWCWRWARTRPVERPRVRGAAVRRRAARQRVAVAILDGFCIILLLFFGGRSTDGGSQTTWLRTTACVFVAGGEVARSGVDSSKVKWQPGCDVVESCLTVSE